jgi:hypothetical protein
MPFSPNSLSLSFEIGGPDAAEVNATLAEPERERGRAAVGWSQKAGDAGVRNEA